MRWSIVRLIWHREMRDQLRDRRTVFMVVVLPLLLYPLLGFGMLTLTQGILQQRNVVGIWGVEHLPEARPGPASPVAAAAWTAAGAGGRLDLVIGTAAWASIDNLVRAEVFPPLLVRQGDSGYFLPSYCESPLDAGTLLVRFLKPSGESSGAGAQEVEQQLLVEKDVDVIVVIPPDFRAQLEKGAHPAIQLLAREGEERSRMVTARTFSVLAHWKKRIKEIRLLRQGLPANFDDPFEIVDPERSKSASSRMAESLIDMMVRVFPFMLVMWSLAGALYPAVDLCAGEKERGTMETLLISPASREEIVAGKFLTIWVFSAATSLLNLLSMGLSTLPFSGALPHEALQPAPLLWCVLLVLPLSAFFSALCLAVGAYARSSKEGQYYLMPLFLLCMPLIFLTLAPGVELDSFYSMVPVTGVALLLQRLMTAASLEQVPWLYFVPVLGPLLLYGWLALRWAVEQFKREEVLFREAERLDLGLWLRQLLREREPTPTTGKALFCFAAMVVLRWLSFCLGPGLTLLLRSGLALGLSMAGPPLVLAVLLTTRPAASLGLRWPSLRALLSAAILSVLLMLPLMEVTQFVLQQFPELKSLLRMHQPLTEVLEALRGGEASQWWTVLEYLFILGILTPLSEELAFRGFILTGLRRRFRPVTAVFISSFLFAVAHMNVFQMVPVFLLGLVLGILAVRSGSVVPGMIFYILHNSLLVSLAAFLPRDELAASSATPLGGFLYLIEAISLLLAGLVLWRGIGARCQESCPDAADLSRRLPDKTPDPLSRLSQGREK